MKKFLIIALSAVFVLGLAATAFAIHAEIPSETQAVVAKGETQITLGGSIRIRGEVRNADLDGTTDASSWYDERVRLSIDAKVSDDVSGFVMLESTNHSYLPDKDGYTWGSYPGAATGVYGNGNVKPTDVQLLQAWILYKSDMVNLKIGHMPLALGNKLFFDHRKFGDDAIVLFKDVDNTHLAAIAIKLNEGDTAFSDDADAYVALFAHKGDGFNISGDITWVNDDAFGSGMEADLYNIGLRADTTMGGLKLKGDVEFQTGDTNAGLTDFDTMCSVADCDFGGYALMGSVTADLDTMTVALEAGYGSGDTTDDGDFDLFVSSLNSGTPYIAFVHGTRTGTNNPIYIATSSGAGTSNGISNLTYVKGSVSGSLGDNVTGKADIIWLTASEDNSSGEDGIGVEVDGKITYKVAKNLVYWIEGGYLFSDDYYGADSDDAYALRHGIQLSF